MNVYIMSISDSVIEKKSEMLLMDSKLKEFIVDESLKISSSLAVWVGANFILGRPLNLSGFTDVALNELISRLGLMKVIKKILDIFKIPFLNNMVIKGFLGHIGSFIIIFWVRHRKFPTFMIILNYLIVASIADLMVYPLAKSLYKSIFVGTGWVNQDIHPKNIDAVQTYDSGMN